jgi:hypothetical protein
MLQFSARSFFWSGLALRSIRMDCAFAAVQCVDGQVAYAMTREMSEKTRKKASDRLVEVEGHFRTVGLVYTADTTKDLIEQLSYAHRISYQWVNDQIDNIERLAEKELRERFFIHILQDRLRFWPTTAEGDLFGPEVYTKFPSAREDIRCAGLAFGTSLPTASVFHLMRVMEVGLSALGKVFGISLGQANWEPAIAQMESKIAGMRNDPVWRLKPDYKEQHEYYSQAASYFRTVKDAWRNYAIHGRAVYTLEENEIILVSVQAFMKKLAERVAEQ